MAVVASRTSRDDSAFPVNGEAPPVGPFMLRYKRQRGAGDFNPRPADVDKRPFDCKN